MGYFKSIAIEEGTPYHPPVRQLVRPAKVKASDLLGFGRFNESLHWRITERGGLPAYMQRGPRLMLIGFHYGKAGVGVPVLKRHGLSWAAADDLADRLIEADVLQLAYIKEY